MILQNNCLIVLRQWVFNSKQGMMIIVIIGHFITSYLDYCHASPCGDDQKCISLTDTFNCICKDENAFLVNGSCVIPSSTAEVCYKFINTFADICNLDHCMFTLHYPVILWKWEPV